MPQDVGRLPHSVPSVYICEICITYMTLYMHSYIFIYAFICVSCENTKRVALGEGSERGSKCLSCSLQPEFDPSWWKDRTTSQKLSSDCRMQGGMPLPILHNKWKRLKTKMKRTNKRLGMPAKENWLACSEKWSLTEWRVCIKLHLLGKTCWELSPDRVHVEVWFWLLTEFWLCLLYSCST